MIFNKECKNKEKYKALCPQGLYLLNHKTKKLSFVFHSKWFSTKNAKIRRNIRPFTCKACNSQPIRLRNSVLSSLVSDFQQRMQKHEKEKVCIQSICKGDNSRRIDGRTDGRSDTFACKAWNSKTVCLRNSILCSLEVILDFNAAAPVARGVTQL